MTHTDNDTVLRIFKDVNKTRTGQGDIWTWIGIDANSKLAISWLVEPRTTFMHDLASRLKNRVRLSTDKLSWYRAAVEETFGWNRTDYGMISKTFGNVADEHGGGGMVQVSFWLRSKKSRS